MSHPAGSFGVVELTETISAIAASGASARVVTGGFGTGKTSALLQRWARLAAEAGAGRVLWIARSPAAAADTRRRMVAAAAEAGLVAGPLAVTTWTGLGLDLTRRHVEGMADAALVTGAHQRRLVAEVFEADRPQRATVWAGSSTVVERRAFPYQLAAAVRAYLSSALADDEIAANADVAAVADRWRDLAGFVARYRDALRARNGVDAAEVIGLAASVMAQPDVQADFATRFVEVIIDDGEVISPAAAVLLDLVGPAGVATTLSVNPDGMRSALVREPIAFAAQFAAAHQADAFDLPGVEDVGARLVQCRHPSIEADAVVGEIVAAHADGVAWHEIAVVVPRENAPIARAVTRALRRRDIPVHVGLVDGDAEPVVRRLRAALEAADQSGPVGAAVDDAVAAMMGDIAGAVDLVSPEPSLDRAIDALVAFGRAAHTWAAAQPASRGTVAEFLDALQDADGPLLTDDYRDADGEGVAVVSLDGAAGRHWRVVVAPSLVEGEYPRVDATVGWFDAAITTVSGPVSVAARREVAVAEQRRRFGVLASRGDCVVYVTAPPPGVLVSRYVQNLTAEEARPAWAEPVAPPPRPPTISLTPMHPSGRLRLSASQLSNFEDCARRWYFASVLRLDDSSSVWTAFGSLVHNVLEAFLDPKATSEYSLDALLELSEEMWTDAVAQWKPQQEQARRELREILQKWWDIEGSALKRADVIDVELEFEVAVGNHVVRGRIDRVDYDRDRNGVAVVDYKTGRPPRERDRDDIAHDLQLAVYYLAALRSEQLAQIGPPTRLELLYIKAKDPFFEQPITADHEAVAEARILLAAQEMLDEHLEPNVEADCDHCDFHRLCPLQKAGREVGAAR